MRRLVYHPVFRDFGYAIRKTGHTYRVEWFSHRTDSGRDWSDVNHDSIDFP